MRTLGAKPQIVLMALGLFALNIYIYSAYILPSSQARYVFYFPPISPISFLYPVYVLMAVVPGLLVPKSCARPSDYIFLFLYFMLYIPSISFFAMFSADFDFPEIVATFIFSVAFCMLLLKNYVPKIGFKAHNDINGKFWYVALAVIIGGAMFAALVFGDYSVEALSEDVYDRRRYIKEGLSDTPPFILYICNWLGSAIGPFLVVAGLFSKRPTLVLIGLIAGILAFAISTHKINALTSIITALFYFVVYRKNGRISAVSTGYFIVGFIYFGPLLITVATGDIVSLWATTFRLTLNNGFLSATYIDLFSDLPMVLYADSFMSSFYSSPLPDSIAGTAGTFVSSLDDNNANANFLANGYANMGLIGLFFAGFECIVLMWMYDTVSTGKNSVICATLAISPALVLANTGVHTALSSNGLFLLIVLIWMLPGSQRPLSSRSSRSVGQAA